MRVRQNLLKAPKVIIQLVFLRPDRESSELLELLIDLLVSLNIGIVFLHIEPPRNVQTGPVVQWQNRRQ